ncbi:MULTISPECIES: ATP-binding protein [Microbacterium]|uniref:AAA family ATPase n=1 Tax=Microbacterium TaxID=33882 RepID=UPI0003DDFC7B|nr:MULTISPECIES: ATP-binding protein [Microbacterium]CDK01837.1 AAA ATPase, central region [Microbacterium sp. C448]
MENFDVIQALARTALAGNPEAIEHQVTRLAERLAESGDDSNARKLRSLITRARNRQAVEPINLQPSDVATAAPTAQRLGPKTALPVDRESGAPLCEVVTPDRRRALPVLPVQAQAAYDSLVREWQHEAELAQVGLPISRTLLIYGPPGTGKTTLALAISVRLGRPAVIARLDGLISSLLGNTARNLGALFDFCNRYDCVLILDEFDAVAKIRDDANEVGEIKRVVNALLQNLDKRTEFGLTIAVTNHEKLLDSAVWRRFEHQIHLGMPTYEGRVEIGHLLLDRLEEVDPLAKAVASVTSGRSGADVRTLAMAFLKSTVLATRDARSPVTVLREAAQATGIQGADGLDSTDQQLAKHLNEPPASLSQSELGVIFGRDRKTISRWLNPSEVKV